MRANSCVSIVPRARVVASALGLLLGLASSAHATGKAILYVDDDAPSGGDGQSWDTAFRFLRDALVLANTPGSGIIEVRLAQGTYKPTAMRPLQVARVMSPRASPCSAASRCAADTQDLALTIPMRGITRST
jgi:hypothetical protein